MNDAGNTVDAVVALRRLMSTLDSAAFALAAVNDTKLSDRLTANAADVLRALERLERSEVYLAARKDYLDANSNPNPET